MISAPPLSSGAPHCSTQLSPIISLVLIGALGALGGDNTVALRLMSTVPEELVRETLYRPVSERLHFGMVNKAPVFVV